MSSEEEGEIVTADVRAIGVSFGNSNSSIAYTSGVCCILFPPDQIHKPLAGTHVIGSARKARQK